MLTSNPIRKCTQVRQHENVSRSINLSNHSNTKCVISICLRMRVDEVGLKLGPHVLPVGFLGAWNWGIAHAGSNCCCIYWMLSQAFRRTSWRLDPAMTIDIWKEILQIKIGNLWKILAKIKVCYKPNRIWAREWTMPIWSPLSKSCSSFIRCFHWLCFSGSQQKISSIHSLAVLLWIIFCLIQNVRWQLEFWLLRLDSKEKYSNIVILTVW